jgi:uncharacterized protein
VEGKPVPVRIRRRFLLVLILAAAIVALANRSRLTDIAVYRLEHPSGGPGAGVKLIKNPRTIADRIVNGAKTEAINGVHYDSEYVRISYPNGDVPSDQGACTDVVIRALRNAGFDLQMLIHRDMTAHFSLYPKKWGLSGPDPNIDHRRVPNQMVFFKRFGTELPKSLTGSDLRTWKPGDIVYWDLANGHTGVISNLKNARGIPLVIHNLAVTCEGDCLESWPIIGHFRFPKGQVGD